MTKEEAKTYLEGINPQPVDEANAIVDEALE